MHDFRAFILDLDGVVYRGEQALPGAAEFVRWCDQTDRRVLFVSNNSFALPVDVTAKLARLGIPRPEGRVLTAGAAAVETLAGRHPGGSVYVLAVPDMAELCRRAGLRVVWRETIDAAVPDAVLVGLDRTLTYDRLRRGLRAIMAGATFLAVNRDPALPMEDGLDPGTGSIVVALEYASGKAAEIVGKPEPGIMLRALAHLDSAAADTLVVGDGLELDIVAGHRAGLTTALVLSGLSSATQAAVAEGDRKPDIIAEDLVALLEMLRASPPQ